MKSYEKKARSLLAQMTLEEKAGLCSGSNLWWSKGVERLGVQKIMMTDGPHGLRKQATLDDQFGISQSVPATCFPTAATTACSFDPDLLEEMGKALGEECLQEGVSILLGPGVNIKRSPLCGRNFEYFSEDPYLAGVMASALIEGVQSQGVGTSLKHFAANNQETRRMVINAVVDERALREIYLSAFEMAVKKAHPWTLMCCYNEVNGEFGSQNKILLTDILRGEWGFDGAVVTDWGAVVDRVKGLAAGLDLEMPYSGPHNDQAIVDAVRSGALPIEVLDAAATRVLCLLLAAVDSRKQDFRYDVGAHHELARKVAASSSVLLKNEGLLPLSKDKRLAVVGAFAKEPRYQGAGSSRINPLKLDNLCDVLRSRGVDFAYAPGYDLECDAGGLERDTPNGSLLEQAESVAKGADVAVVCIGLPDSYESEGFDRTHMRLPESHVALLKKVAGVNPNVVVLLSSGSAVEMPWLVDAKALLMLYLGGEAGAEAAADLLFGDVNPSGRLAESFPLRLEDTPSFAYFPGGEKTVEYRESVYVGYRYYDKAGVDVLFPFGYGLSYTSFAYGGLTLVQKEDHVEVSLTVKNTGNVAGAEVVQIYVSQKSPSVFKPIRELKGFRKVYLQPGEARTIALNLDRRAFSYYDVDEKAWVVEAGDYTVAAAASSRDIRCEVSLTMEAYVEHAGQQLERAGQVRQPERAGQLGHGDHAKHAAHHAKAKSQPASYLKPSSPFEIPDEDFEALYGRPLPPSSRKPGEPFTMNSTLSEIATTRTGTAFLAQVQQQMAGMTGLGQAADSGRAAAAGDETMVRMMQHMMSELPLRALVTFSQGALDFEYLSGLLAAMNAELSANTQTGSDTQMGLGAQTRAQ